MNPKHMDIPPDHQHKFVIPIEYGTEPAHTNYISITKITKLMCECGETKVLS